MKKTLAALVVGAAALTASSFANAAVIYEEDGSKLSLGGSLRMMIGKDGKDANGHSKRGDLMNDGSRLILDARHKLGNGFSGLFGYEMRFEGKGSKTDSYSFGDPQTNKLFGGIEHDQVGVLLFGKQVTSADDVELGDWSYSFGGNSDLTTSNDKVVKFRSLYIGDKEHGSLGRLSLGLDYSFGNAEKQYNDWSDYSFVRNLDGTYTRKPARGAVYGADTYGDTDNYKNGYGASLFYVNEFNDDVTLNVNAGYTHDRQDNPDPRYNGYKPGHGANGFKKSWEAGAQLSVDRITVAAHYGQTKYENFFNNSTSYSGAKYDYVNSEFASSLRDGKDKFLLVGFKVDYLDNSRVYGQWMHEEHKSDVLYNKVSSNDKFKVNRYLVGLDYRFTENVLAYGEYMYSKNDKDKITNFDQSRKEHIFGVGMRVYF